jgi:hypothetical protein
MQNEDVAAGEEQYAHHHATVRLWPGYERIARDAPAALHAESTSGEMIRRGPSRRCSFNGGQSQTAYASQPGPHDEMKLLYFAPPSGLGFATTARNTGYDQAKMGFVFDD